MKEIKGNLDKMRTEAGKPVKYFLPVGNELIALNPLIGKKAEIEYTGNIHCKACGNISQKSFGQGYCYPCFMSVPETAPCILHPEKCEAHKGIYRDKEFAEKTCLRPHYVYLAITAGLKVGVTRETQIPTRWIDQGAVKAIKLAKTPNRHIAGLIELSLKKHISDRTSWQKMLKNETEIDIKLAEEKEKAKKLLDTEFQKYLTFDKRITSIDYPIEKYPKKIKALNLDKTKKISGAITGIKGQYIFFDTERVINIRKFSAYEVFFRF
jgi:hypothetical protein